ncbi:hypothetical protein NDU88_004220 [Pleurodeles waltl]|uniref:Uncharacterized protein n=1 Tax=Pleurodeles waltl TaxID=8319 RepID=A0AAV7VJ76_PLEWA|nr:hypothetical protein NDU88_004220 [Pleurodeles waltl]
MLTPPGGRGLETVVEETVAPTGVEAERAACSAHGDRLGGGRHVACLGTAALRDGVASDSWQGLLRIVLLLTPSNTLGAGKAEQNRVHSCWH